MTTMMMTKPPRHPVAAANQPSGIKLLMEREEQLSIFGQLDLLCEGGRERKRRVSPSALKLFDRLPPQFTALCKAYDPLSASLPPSFSFATLIAPLYENKLYIICVGHLKGFRLHFQTMKENLLLLFLQLPEIPSAQSPSPEVWQHSHGMSPVGIEMRITTKVGGKRKHARRG